MLPQEVTVHKGTIEDPLILQTMAVLIAAVDLPDQRPMFNVHPVVQTFNVLRETQVNKDPLVTRTFNAHQEALMYSDRPAVRMHSDQR